MTTERKDGGQAQCCQKAQRLFDTYRAMYRGWRRWRECPECERQKGGA
jgi:hypothetical protein